MVLNNKIKNKNKNHWYQFFFIGIQKYKSIMSIIMSIIIIIIIIIFSQPMFVFG